MARLLLFPLGLMFFFSIIANLALGAAYGYTQPVTLTITPSGVQSFQAADCPNPLSGIPVLSNIFGFFTWLGQQAQGVSNTACLAQASAIISLTYDPTQQFNYANLFISVVAIGIGAVVLASANILGSGLTSGGVLAAFIGASLLMIWLMLSTAPLFILATFPLNLGTLIYGGLTLLYAVGVVTAVGGSGAKP